GGGRARSQTWSTFIKNHARGVLACDFFVAVTLRFQLNETHLRRILHEWVRHYNRGRPHSSLGPGIPEQPTAMCTGRSDRHHLPAGHHVTPRPVLGGLHHEYRLEPAA